MLPRPIVGAAQPQEANLREAYSILAIAARSVHSNAMAKRRIFDAEHHAQFVTFSCYRRRRFLDHPVMRDTFVSITAEKLREHHGICSGFVVMPDHVHAIVWFDTAGALSPFMKSWKQTTSLRLKREQLLRILNTGS
jgi:REP element-mobilizing transposase RayT